MRNPIHLSENARQKLHSVAEMRVVVERVGLIHEVAIQSYEYNTTTHVISSNKSHENSSTVARIDTPK